MTCEQDWSIVFYTTEQGDSPVEAFLQSLDLKTQARFDWSIEQRQYLSGDVLLFHGSADCVFTRVPEKDSQDTQAGDRDSREADE